MLTRRHTLPPDHWTHVKPAHKCAPPPLPGLGNASLLHLRADLGVETFITDEVDTEGVIT